jgi:transcriptional regulator with XRE-family HTH domain
MSLGRRLRELREAAGLSQDQIASIAGVSRNAVSQWESDKTRPSTSRLGLIARTLNVAVEELLSPSAQVRDAVIEAATRLFARNGVARTSIDDICSACGIEPRDFELIFPSKEELLLHMLCLHEDRKLAEIRRLPPIYGTLATRLKYLLRQFYVLDLAHADLIRALHGMSWTWADMRERDYARQLLATHDLIITCLDDAAAQGQIDSGNFRAASSLVLAAYQIGLRKAVFETLDPDRTMTFLEPQLAIILKGFNFRIIPGFAESEKPEDVR